MVPNRSPLSIALRAYVLALSFSTLPALLPTVLTRLAAETPYYSRSSSRTAFDVLRRELGPTGMPFAMATAAGGGKWLSMLYERYLSWSQDAQFGEQSGGVQLVRRLQWTRMLAYTLSSWLAIRLLHMRRRAPTVSPYPLTFPVGTHLSSGRNSQTLDFTLLLLVRAFDALLGNLLQSGHLQAIRVKDGKDAHQWRHHLDAFVFWGSCSRIMWCFFYEPQRLPKSYNRWIASLAAIDPRIVDALRALRNGTWNYGAPSLTHGDLLVSFSHDLGYPSSWGKPELLPSRGGTNATRTWRKLGVLKRDGIGGIPCEIVHGGVGGKSCVANASLRALRAFYQALLIYLPIYFLPPLLLRPRNILQSTTRLLFSSIRSASFLATFVSSMWFSVCFTRTLVMARVFPLVSHNTWDGPTFGCITAGSIMCGASIFIESGRRRGEMALYVLPRAVRTALNEAWISGRMQTIPFHTFERLMFAISLGYLLSASTASLDPLRGLSRWTLRFVLQGPDMKTYIAKMLHPKEIGTHPPDDLKVYSSSFQTAKA